MSITELKSHSSGILMCPVPLQLLYLGLPSEKYFMKNSSVSKPRIKRKVSYTIYALFQDASEALQENEDRTYSIF